MATVAAISTAFQTIISAGFPLTARVYAEQPDTVAPTLGKAVIFPLIEDGNIAETPTTEMSIWHIVVLTAPESIGYANGQKAINAWLNATGNLSLKRVIEADQTMGGVIHTNNCPRCLDRGLIEVGGQSYWGAKLEVEVWAS